MSESVGDTHPAASRFDGLHAAVTGVTRGIGAAVARQLVAEGAIVTGIARDEDALEAFGRTLPENKFRAVVGDVSSDTDRRRFLEIAAGAADELDVVVNNAALFSTDSSETTWDLLLNVNVVSPALLVDQATPYLRRSSQASVVNVSSISGHIAQHGRAVYNTTKGAILTLTRCQATDLAPDKIRVNSVSPGWIWTEMTEANAKGERQKWEAIWGAYHLLARCGEPEEVAQAICFLASSQASFITGADLAVDGGYLAIGPEGAGSAFELGTS